MSKPILSILIASIPERTDMLENLLFELYDQIEEIPIENQVEILVFTDNKMRSIGMKREALKKIANGNFFCFLDDDDGVNKGYVKELWSHCKDNIEADVIMFDSLASVNGDESHISVSMDNDNEQYNHDGITLRKPCHVNCWNKKFKKYKFTNKNYGEDFDFAKECYPHVKTSIKINKILHKYIFKTEVTKAF